MTDPIFVRIRNDQGKVYDSYTDYWRLVELAGFPACELDEVDPHSGRRYIFSPDNGTVRENLKSPKHANKTSHYTLWYLERPNHINNTLPDHFDSVWISDRSLPTYLTPAFPEQTITYVTIGGHPHLGGYKQPPRYDFIHLSYLYGRREDLTNRFTHGARVAPNGWLEEREESLRTSRWGIAFHQDDMPIIEPLRYILFACWKIPIIAEVSNDYYPYEVVPREAFHPHHDYAELAERNYQKMTQELLFRSCIEAVLCE